MLPHFPLAIMKQVVRAAVIRDGTCALIANCQLPFMLAKGGVDRGVDFIPASTE